MSYVNINSLRFGMIAATDWMASKGLTSVNNSISDKFWHSKTSLEIVKLKLSFWNNPPLSQSTVEQRRAFRLRQPASIPNMVENRCEKPHLLYLSFVSP